MEAESADYAEQPVFRSPGSDQSSAGSSPRALTLSEWLDDPSAPQQRRPDNQSEPCAMRHWLV